MGDLFFWNGKHFDTLEEMMEYSKEWNEKKLDEESFQLIFEHLRREIILNIHLFESEITNMQFSQMIEDTFLDFMRYLLDHKFKETENE